MCLKHFVPGEEGSLARAAERPGHGAPRGEAVALLGGWEGIWGCIYFILPWGAAFPSVLAADSPALSLSTSPSCWEQPPRYPPVFLSPHPLFFRFLVVGFFNYYFGFFIPL